MSSTTSTASAASVSTGAVWTGRVMSWLPALFLLLDAVMKLVRPEFVVKATVELGYPEGSIAGMGVALLVSTVLYLIPSSAVLGAILVTGYLGGAVATQVHAGHGADQIWMPVFVGVLIWGGLWLRDPRLRALTPLVI